MSCRISLPLAAKERSGFVVTERHLDKAAICARLDIKDLLALRHETKIQQNTDGGFTLKGRMRALLLRVCVVSNLLLEEKIETTVGHVLGLSASKPRPDDLSIDDVLEEDTLDMGELAVQDIALTMNPYPRHPSQRLASCLGQAGTREDKAGNRLGSFWPCVDAPNPVGQQRNRRS